MRRKMVTGLVLVMAAAAAAPAPAGKVGFVEVEKVVAEVQEGKAKLKELEEWAKPRREQLQQMRKHVTELHKNLAKQRGVASEEALKKLQEETVQAGRQLEDATRNFKRDYEEKQNQLLAEVAEKMRRVIEDYAKANDYDAILIFKPRTIIYLSDSADLTDTVIRLYNQRFPVTMRTTNQLGDIGGKKK